MSKRKVKFCIECRRKTVHEYVGKETIGDGMGIVRVILAIGSMGISETITATKYWQCQCCGKPSKE